MNLQNGYKVIYEKAANGMRTFYASKSTIYPNDDDLVIASFKDEDFRGKVVYEHAGKFYVSTGAVPAYDENGEPTDTVVDGFDKVFVEAEDTNEDITGAVSPEEPEDEINVGGENSENTPEEGPTFDLPTFEEEDEE